MHLINNEHIIRKLLTYFVETLFKRILWQHHFQVIYFLSLRDLLIMWCVWTISKTSLHASSSVWRHNTQLGRNIFIFQQDFTFSLFLCTLDWNSRFRFRFFNFIVVWPVLAEHYVVKCLQTWHHGKELLSTFHIQVWGTCPNWTM